MQELLPPKSNVISTESGQYAGNVTMQRHIDLDRPSNDPLATMQKLANRMERLAVEITTVEQREEDERNDLRALANEMRSLACRTVSLVADVMGSAGNRSPSINHEDGIGCASHDATSMLALTEYERHLFEKNIGKVGREIAEQIGMPSALLLIAKCGGNMIAPHGKDLVFLNYLLGIEAASKLKKWLGITSLTVPVCQQAKSAVIHHRIRAEFDRLTTVEKLSSRAAVRRLTRFSHTNKNERSIWRILKGTDQLTSSMPD